MDFFEKAHVSKKESLKKDNKSEETVKKQLKQMLEGYKQSDNKLIRKSENVYHNPQQLLDDSSSVSGFSDLNLTNSSNELDMSRDHNNDGDETIPDFSETKDNAVIKDETISSTLDSLDSISECNDVLESLSEDISKLSNTSLGEDEIDNISYTSSTSDTATEESSETSESFDAAGALAMKIFQKLDLKNNVTVDKVSKKKNKPNKKEKKSIPKLIVEEIEQEEENEVSDSEFKLDDHNELRTDEEMETDDSGDDSNKSITNSNVSSPSISVTATEMPIISFSDVLGNYRHSSANINSSDIHTINSTTDKIFPVDVSENNIVIDIDVQSHDDDDDYDEEQQETQYDYTEYYDSSDINEVMTDDSTIREDTLESEHSDERESSMECSEEFVNLVKVYYAKSSCILVLKHPAELYIHGKVKIKALGGTVEILGYTLKDDIYKIYAPNYNYAHCLRTVDAENAYYGLFGKLTAVGLSIHEAEEIVTSIGECDGVVCLTSLKCTQMDFVENNFAITDLFTKTNRNIDNSLRETSEVLGCSLYLSKPWKYFEENASWTEAVKYALEKQSRGIVCGGKGVGKSTFLRYCVNRLLSQGPVLVIDLDPGQAEFTVAGSVSATVVTEPLLGPNFTHLTKPDMMLYLGMINTMDNLRRYTAAISKLIAHCKNHKPYQRMPWVINTMGMCNAMGLKIITHVILHTQPTYVLQIDSKIAKKRFQLYLQHGLVKKIYYEEFIHDPLFRNVPDAESLMYSFFMCDAMISLGKKDFSLAPRDERYLNYLAYFGDLLRAREEESLLGITPYELNFRELHIGLNVRVAPEAALKVINGKIVALCQLPLDNAAVFTLSDNPLLCLGHGLIRAVDYKNEKLFIITPCSQLAAVNTLVYADWVPELRGQERRLPEGVVVPYRTTATRQQRQLMTAPRRRFNPLQLLRLSRSS